MGVMNEDVARVCDEKERKRPEKGRSSPRHHDVARLIYHAPHAQC